MDKVQKTTFTDYTQTDTPDESSLRKNYVPKCYEETLNNIPVLYGNENILIVRRRNNRCKWKKVANVVIGILKSDQTLSDK
jgi:hypothetical protein